MIGDNILYEGVVHSAWSSWGGVWSANWYCLCSVLLLQSYSLVLALPCLFPAASPALDSVPPCSSTTTSGVPHIFWQYLSLGPQSQYFIQGVLKAKDDISDGIGAPDLELTICLAVCWVLLFLTLWKGVASSGKVAYFTAIFPYMVLISLIIRGLTLPGAADGVLFYLTPKCEGLTSGIIAVVCDTNTRWNRTLVTGIICVIEFLIGLIYVTPGGQAWWTSLVVGLSFSSLLWWK